MQDFLEVIIFLGTNIYFWIFFMIISLLVFFNIYAVIHNKRYINKAISDLNSLVGNQFSEEQINRIKKIFK